MKVLVATVGSRGDVQPYVALARGLQAAGHDVILCTSIRFKDFVVEHGLEYAYLNDDLVALLDTMEGRSALEDMGGFLSGIKTAVKLFKKTGPIQQSLLEETWQAAEAVNPDLIVYSSKMGGAPHYAEKLGCRVAMAVPFPQLVPTAAYASIGFSAWRLGGWYNRLTYRIVLAIAGRVGRKYIRAWRETHDLPQRTAATDILHDGDGTPIPVLHGISSHVVPEPDDWPEGTVNTGYWFLDRADDWRPPAALEAFLAADDRVVYVGFGSMAGRDPRRVTRVVIDALAKTGLRAVLASGWGGLTPGELPDSVFALDQVPHDWLFPKMAAVVHHGGAGTTAAGQRMMAPK